MFTLIQFTALQSIQPISYQIIATDNQTKIVFNEEKLNLSVKFAQRIYHILSHTNSPVTDSLSILLSIEIGKKSLEIICIYVQFLIGFIFASHPHRIPQNTVISIIMVLLVMTDLLMN